MLRTYTNRAWRRVTSLIETNALPLSQAATPIEGTFRILLAE